MSSKSITIAWSKPDAVPTAKQVTETTIKDEVLVNEIKSETEDKESSQSQTVTPLPTETTKKTEETEKKSAIMEPTKSSIRDIINSVSNDDNTNSESNDSIKNENDENSNSNAGNNNNENYYNEEENNDVFDSLFGTNEEK